MINNQYFNNNYYFKFSVVLDEKKPEVIEIIPTSSLHDCEATVELLKLNALELAKQMTLIEFEMYHAIIPSEFTNQVFFFFFFFFFFFKKLINFNF